MPKVSVIVAIYNVDLFLERCLNSLANQTLQDIEIILVDDGSTDLSGNICELFAKQDRRFLVFHKRNEGVACTREFGVKKAIGEYLIHVDPDDWVEPTMLEELYKVALQDNSDVVICNYYEERQGNCKLVRQKPSSLNHIEILTSYISGTLNGFCWNKLVKNSTWNRLKIHFPKTNLCEDTWVNVKLALSPITFSYSDSAYYHYIRGENVGSITSNANKVAGVNAYNAFTSFRELLFGTPYWKVFVQYEMPWMAYLTLYYGIVSANVYKKDFQDLLNNENLDFCVMLSLRCYYLSRLIILLRKIFSHKVKNK